MKLRELSGTSLMLAVLLSLGLASDSLRAQSTPSPITVAPYLQDFDAGPLGGEWDLSPGSPAGRIFLSIDNNPSPVSGGLALVMDSLSGGIPVTNRATLFVDMPASNVQTLLYYAREAFDEEDPNEGVLISDGLNEALIFSHSNLSGFWQEVEIDLVAEAAAAGIALNAQFQIIFQQTSDGALPFDGVLIDDLRLLPPDDSGQANRADAFLDISGGLNANGRPPEIGRNGPFFAESSTLDIEVQGDPGCPWILLLGSLNLNNVIFGGGIGSLDLGLLGTNFADLTIILDGNNPDSLLDTFAVLDPTGRSFLSFGLSFLPPGILGSFQAVVYGPHADVVHLTAAFCFTIP
ncbi:MAG: hypothetical protein V3W41_19205 [Planctomycetota bacterium]